MPDDDLSVSITENGERVEVTLKEQHEFRDLDGDLTTAPVKVTRFAVPNDEEMVAAIGRELLGWCAERQPTPEGKSITQQMDEAYDR